MTCGNESHCTKFVEVIGQQSHVNVQCCLIMIVVDRLFSVIKFSKFLKDYR